MFCIQCGTPLADGEVVCHTCGTVNRTQDTASIEDAADARFFESTPDLGSFGVAAPSGVEKAKIDLGKPLDSVASSDTPFEGTLGLSRQKAAGQQSSAVGSNGRGERMMGSAMDENMAKRIAEQEFRDAKRAYKQARKNAGKSNKGKVIGIIVLILVSFMAGAFTMWCIGDDVIPFENPFRSKATSSESATSATIEGTGTSSSSDATSGSSTAASTTESQQSTSSSTSSTATASSSSTASSGKEAASGNATSALSAASTNSSSRVSGNASTATSDDVIAAGYIGTWKGTMTETRNITSNKKICYGASEQPLELTIDSIESTGRVKAHGKVFVHGHDMSELDRDVDTHSGDVVLELKDLTSTYDDATFEFIADTPDGSLVTIKVSDDGKTGWNRALDVSVECNGAVDVYSLTKE